MSNNNLVLNRFFTQHVFNDLIINDMNNIYNAIVSRYIGDMDNSTNIEVISKIYKYMSKCYRNEYFYQNTMLNKLLLGRHSIRTTTALTQIPIAKSKADFILINGKAIVYEIKTELDNFERLNSQINDYYKGFNYVSVITGKNNIDKLTNLLGDSTVGIMVLTERNTLGIIKEPVENNTHLEYKTIFNILHRTEFEDILLSYYGELPISTPVFYYDECLKMFSEIPMSKLYLLSIKQLKKRNKVIEEYFKLVPYELKSLFYFNKLNKGDYEKLFAFLEHKYRS